MNTISSLDSILMRSSSLSYFLNYSNVHSFICFLIDIFFFISFIVSMKNLSFSLVSETNFELNDRRSLFCFFKIEICLWRRLLSLNYGFIDIYDFYDRRWRECIFILLYWVIILDNLYFEFSCAISVVNVGMDS